MSESIYEAPDYSDIDTGAGNKTEATYANVERNSSRQKMQLNKIQDSPGGRNHGCYKLAVVLLGLLCVLLLAVIAGLSIMATQVQLRYNNFTDENDLVRHEEHKQKKANQTNMIKDLEARNNNLMRETAEKSQLETNLRAMTGERDELQRRLGKLESMMQVKCHAVDVTLDPDTAHAKLILSDDGKQVNLGDKQQNVPNSPKRFSPLVAVLGKEGFTSGSFYYEVGVKGKTGWTIGVAKESINRTGYIYSPENGYWVIWLRKGSYAALLDRATSLSLPNKPQRVAVFVDYKAGLVSFYDADTWYHMYSFKGVSFGEKIYPFFCPDLNEGGTNSAPLIITPVSPCDI